MTKIYCGFCPLNYFFYFGGTPSPLPFLLYSFFRPLLSPLLQCNIGLKAELLRRNILLQCNKMPCVVDGHHSGHHLATTWKSRPSDALKMDTTGHHFPSMVHLSCPPLSLFLLYYSILSTLDYRFTKYFVIIDLFYLDMSKV